MRYADIPIHPLAEVGEVKPSLVAEYKERFQRGDWPPPIVFLDRKLLAGRHRAAAADEAGTIERLLVEAVYLPSGTDPTPYLNDTTGTKDTTAVVQQIIRLHKDGMSLDSAARLYSHSKFQTAWFVDRAKAILNPKPPKPYTPRPARGPSVKPPIPEGHEHSGQSTLTDADGNVTATWDKTRVAGSDNPPTPIPETFLLTKSSVMQRGDGTTSIQWATYKQDDRDRWEAIKIAVKEHVTEYVRPARPVEPPAVTDADRLVIYPLGDPHIGMMAWGEEVGENFDLKIAERELVECMRQLVARSPAAEQAIVCNLGDFWHAQDDSQRTPKSGNKLDVDSRFGKVAKVGLRIFRALIDEALTKHAQVFVRSIPGNHDPTSSLWLPQVMQAVYENDPRVTVEDGFAPYQYDTFGRVLLGWAHGDGVKLEQLGEIMATDQPEKWGSAAFRYWNTGHVHHWSQKELRGCVVDTHRTLAGRDAWHHHSGYRSGRSLKAVTYHRLYGLDSVAVVGVERVRSALESRAA